MAAVSRSDASAMPGAKAAMMLGILLGAATAAAGSAPPPLTLRSGDATLGIEPATLSLTLSVNGTEWLAGAAFTRASGARLAPADGLLPHAPPARTSGADALGAWSGYNFSWTTDATASAPTWLTSVRAYARGGRIVRPLPLLPLLLFLRLADPPCFRCRCSGRSSPRVRSG